MRMVISLPNQTSLEKVSQLIHVASYGWWRGVPTWTHYHPSTNHNLPHGRVVAQVGDEKIHVCIAYITYAAEN